MKKLVTRLTAAAVSAVMLMSVSVCSMVQTTVFAQEEETISAYAGTELLPSDVNAKTYTMGKKVNDYYRLMGSSAKPITVDEQGFHFTSIGYTTGGSIRINASKGTTVTFSGYSPSGYYVQDGSNGSVFNTSDASGGSFTVPDVGYYFLSTLGAGTIYSVSLGNGGGGGNETSSTTQTTTESTTESTTATTESTTVTTTESTTESTTETTTVTTTATTTESTTESTTATTTESTTETTTQGSDDDKKTTTESTTVTTTESTTATTESTTQSTTTESTTVTTTESSTQSTTESSTESTTEDPYVWGDADSSGGLSSNDSAVIISYLLTPERVNLSKEVVRHCDVNGDGDVSADDAAWVLQKTLMSEFKFKLPDGVKQ